jgi:molecular chaperone DnaJ
MGPGGGYSGGGMNVEDIFRNFGDIFGGGRGGNGGGFDPFESFFGGGSSGGQRQRGRKGSNLRIRVKMSTERGGQWCPQNDKGQKACSLSYLSR